MNQRGNEQQKARINDVLFHIHQDLSAPITAQKLAEIAAYSPHHFHRIFKTVTSENVNDYLRRARLEHAANVLIFSPEVAVIDVAQVCGFRSPASFTHAFKQRFGVTPSDWREGGYHHYCGIRNNTSADPDIASGFERLQDLPLPTVSVRQLPACRVAYVRHQGYDRSISESWRYLRAWATEEGVEWQAQQMLALYHSNPAIIPLPKCRYVACITVDESVWRRGRVGVLTIPAGAHAVMKVEGKYGEFLPVMQKFMHHWLPQSDYQLGSTPAYTRYFKNAFLADDERFELEFCVPLSLG